MFKRKRNKVIGILLFIIAIISYNFFVNESVSIDFDLQVNATSNKELEEIRFIIDRDIKGYTSLVNKDKAYNEVCVESDLVIPNVNLVTHRDNPKNLLRKKAASALEQMLSHAKEKNINIFLSSGHRTFERQSDLYAAKLKKEEESDTSYVAPPGYSEHETGLAVDLTCKSMNFKLEEEFENTEEGKWLMKNAHKYGYILRYPRGEELETGYNYEPWHYRYVGTEISTYLFSNNITLERLYELLEK